MLNFFYFELTLSLNVSNFISVLKTGFSWSQDVVKENKTACAASVVGIAAAVIFTKYRSYKKNEEIVKCKEESFSEDDESDEEETDSSEEVDIDENSQRLKEMKKELEETKEELEKIKKRPLTSSNQQEKERCEVKIDLLQQVISGLKAKEKIKKSLEAWEVGTIYVPEFKQKLPCITYTLTNGKKITVKFADITTLNKKEFDISEKTFGENVVNAIVNAVNEKCLGGSGVNGAIHKAINDDVGEGAFLEIGRNLPVIEKGNSFLGYLGYDQSHRCETGDAKLVPGLSVAPFIIQAVAPRKEAENRKALLKRVYQKSLEAAGNVKNFDGRYENIKICEKYGFNEDIYNQNIKRIAFPSLGTGIFGCPKEEAAEAAVNTVVEFLLNDSSETPLEEVQFIFFEPGELQTTKADYNRCVRYLNDIL